MSWYRKASTAQEPTVFYVPLISAKLHDEALTSGIRLAHACPGVMAGEDRFVTIYPDLEEAAIRHPFAAIAEVHIPATYAEAAEPIVTHKRVVSRDSWTAQAKEYNFRMDIPAN